MPNYGPISSQAYGIWHPEQEYADAVFFESWIRNGKGPALELGCGDGRLLIPFLAKGLDVEGVDLSPYMLDQCRKKAARKGLSPKLHCQAMQDLGLPRKFATIYIPFNSFTLIHSIKEVNRALLRFYEHLLPKGALLIHLTIPKENVIRQTPSSEGAWNLNRVGMRSDGAVVERFEKVSYNFENQTVDVSYLYRVTKEREAIASEEEEFRMRWHFQDQMKRLLENAGFRDISCFREHTEEQAKPSDREFVFAAVR